MKATEHSGRFVLNDSARTRPSSWRRCDDVLDYIWRQKVLLQDKTSKIEKLQQLLHSERQRTELPIGAYGERVEREIFRRPMVHNSQRFQYCVPER